MKKMRSAIVGTGGIAQAHLNAIRSQAGRVELVGVMDLDAGRAEAFCAKHDLKVNRYADLPALLAAERPDLVQICSPPSVHCAQIEAALAAGAHVWSEKPLCASLAEFDRITAAEQRSGRFCGCVFQWRSGTGGEHVRGLIQRNELGRPCLGLIQTTWYRTMEYYGAPWRGKWRTEVGGTTMAHGIHALDFLLWLFGDWEEVRAMTGTVAHPIEVEDVSLAMIRMANGMRASFVSSAVSAREESYLRFDFEKATVELRHLYRYQNADWRFSLPDKSADTAKLAEWARIPTDAVSSHERQFAQLLDSLERGERPSVSGDEARRVLEFVSALYKSAHTGRPIRRGSIVPGDPHYRHVSGQV